MTVSIQSLGAILCRRLPLFVGVSVLLFVFLDRFAPASLAQKGVTSAERLATVCHGVMETAAKRRTKMRLRRTTTSVPAVHLLAQRKIVVPYNRAVMTIGFAIKPSE